MSVNQIATFCGVLFIFLQLILDIVNFRQSRCYVCSISQSFCNKLVSILSGYFLPFWKNNLYIFLRFNHSGVSHAGRPLYTVLLSRNNFFSY